MINGDSNHNTIKFLSTPSSQRATRSARTSRAAAHHFYPRPLRRGRPVLVLRSNTHPTISIHALFAEGDADAAPTLTDLRISIHALFAEGDGRHARNSVRHTSFLSTPSSQRATSVYHSSPLGKSISIHALFAEGDMINGDSNHNTIKFLSTPSSQRATRSARTSRAAAHHFYPRPLRRGRRRSPAPAPR